MRRAASTILVLTALVLAGCNNTSAVLDPSALQPVGADQAPQVAAPLPAGQQQDQPAAASPPPTTTPSQPSQTVAALPAGSARVHFAPVVGATESAASPLASRLSARATERGIDLAPADAAGTTHMLKGYFSAFTEGRETTVIYVWDVLNPAGTRLHRIQGQQKVATNGGEGWSAVTPPAMEAIADRTIDDLTQWLASQPG